MIESSREGIANHRSLGYGCLALVLAAVPLTTVAQTSTESARWMDRGAAAMQQGNSEEAEQDFRHAIASSPRSADATLDWGWRSCEKGCRTSAEVACAGERFETGDPQRAYVPWHCAASDELPRPGDRQLKEEIKLQPASAEALTWLGIIDLQAKKPGRPQQHSIRLQHRRPRIRIFSTTRFAPTLWLRRRRSGVGKGRPRSWYIHRAQAEIDSEGGQSDKAVEEYQAAVNRNPGDATYMKRWVTKSRRLAIRWKRRAPINPRLRSIPTMRSHCSI